MSGSSSAKWGDVIGNKQSGIETKPHKGLAKLYGKPKVAGSKDVLNQESIGNGNKKNKKPKKTSVSVIQQ